MPSQITHLAVAKRFIEKHPHVIKDMQRFFDGSVVPDLDPDKGKSHCGIRTEKHDILKYNREKVNPEKFLATHNLSDDFDKGQYLHLYVDYKCYNEFLLDYFQQDKPSKQINIDIYEASRRDDEYLSQKYGVTYADTNYARELEVLNATWDNEAAEKRREPGYCFDMPYDLDALENFIEKMSDTELPQM